jgi:hypothetical protein
MYSDFVPIVTMFATIMGCIIGLVVAVKSFRDAGKVNKAAGAGADEQQKVLISTGYELEGDSTPNNLHFKVPGSKLLLRLVVSIVIGVAIFFGGDFVTSEFLSQSMIGVAFVVVLLLIAPFFLIAAISALRLLYRFFLYVFLR